MYALFDRFADRYDLHTPPAHYQHDHAFVLETAAAIGSRCRLLDVGCGTGVLVDKARHAGVIAAGIDASPSMIRVARARVGAELVSERRMQEIDAQSTFDLVVALSWTLNYCESEAELREVLRRFHRALQNGGRVILQVAHAMHVDGETMEDRERGPTGEDDDVTLTYRFVRLDPEGQAMRAEYTYACRSMDERLAEEHLLRVTDARRVADGLRDAGFHKIEVYDSWRRDPFDRSASPFIAAVRGSAGR